MRYQTELNLMWKLSIRYVGEGCLHKGLVKKMVNSASLLMSLIYIYITNRRELRMDPWEHLRMHGMERN